MIELLENLLVPGGRARLSPFVEDAQFHCLFGKVPDSQNRFESMRSILADQDVLLKNIAATYMNFSESGRNFDPEVYLTQEFLDLYLAYYLTTNVSKIQLCLLDLVKKNKISETLKVIDIGVGAGTTAVAVLDFMLAWATASNLAGLSFPVKSLSLECHDVSDVCLSVAERTVSALGNSVDCRRMSLEGDNAMTHAMEDVVSWAKLSRWVKTNVDYEPFSLSGEEQVLLFASNVLSELSNTGKENLSAAIASMPNESIATIIEPGDEKKCNNLNSWKVELLGMHKHLRSIAPCGAIVSYSQRPCPTCWNSRREALHEPILYKDLRKRVSDSRGFDEYSNRLLSWSYFCAQRCEDDLSPNIAEDLHTRYMGTIRRKADNAEWLPLAEEPDDQADKGVVDLIKFCALETQNKDIRELWGRRLPGFIMPRMTYGTPISIANGRIHLTSKPGRWLLPLDQTTEVSATQLESSSGDFLSTYSQLTQHAVDEIAFRLFGFQSMHPFQHEILSRALTGQSILGIAATGGGKSECYILPAMLFSGLTIVVSPLKSLMQDQFEKRIDERYGLKGLATFINGDVGFKEKQTRLKQLELGYYKLAYFTPEQLCQSHVLNALKRAHEHIGIRYLALDEAHCISQWGHDFRDSYLNLVPRLKSVGVNPIRIALTATASPDVRIDLCEELDLINAPLSSGGDVYIHSSNRVELNLIVKKVINAEEKAKDIVDRLRSFSIENNRSNNTSASLVFMPTTGTDPNQPDWYLPKKTGLPSQGRLSAGVTNFASFLERSLEEKVAIYHGKMDFDQNDAFSPPQKNVCLGDLSGRSRKSEQTAFIDNQRSIMVATKGFGMGIDKPNIRLIIHKTPTANLEAYAQEAGRAGRDGQISDVVLYYSPDSTDDNGKAVRSDFDIQDFFLSQKYIRRVDVIAMRKFLATVDREVCGNLYFTCDEVIPFFDDFEGYLWPDFPPRRPKGYESESHSQILNKGYEYEEKKRYINRILSVLYKIRPDIGSRKKVCLVSSVQETGSILIPPNSGSALKNPEAILESNAYYGELLRSKNVDANSLKDWIKCCTTSGTIEFARFLGMSVAETASMLWDIKRSDGELRSGRYGKWWESHLLDFKTIASPNYGMRSYSSKLSVVRHFLGAIKRATPPEAKRRAIKAVSLGEKRPIKADGTINTIDDDWFSEREIPYSKGWEVSVGTAFSEPALFESYLETFMDLHDRRQANDRSAYNLLLTDYVGANEDGSLSSDSREKPCLRAVLLGYLKTGEVVLGNCHSCSRCEPDGNFELDLEKRAKVVERLGTEIIDHLDFLEMNTSTVPVEKDLKLLWDIVKAEEDRGRSLGAYVEGWAGRVLTDSPGHVTANLIRVDGMVKGVLSLQPQEACLRALEIIDRVEDEELQSLQGTIGLFSSVLPELPESLQVQAKFNQRIGDFTKAQFFWKELLKSTASNALQHTAYSELCGICASNGPISHAELFTEYSLGAARTAVTFNGAEKYYLQVKPKWSWEDIRAEIVWLREQKRPEDYEQKLLDWWLISHSGIDVLASSAPSDNWPSILDYVLDILSQESLRDDALTDDLLSLIEKWSSRILQEQPTAFPLHALRVGLYGNGYNQNHIDIEDEFLSLIDSENIEALEWLSNSISSQPRLSQTHYLFQLTLAELNYHHGKYSKANNYWYVYVNNPPPEASDQAIRYVLSKLEFMHRPGSVLADKDSYKAVINAIINKTNSWEKARVFYETFLKEWSILQLTEELKSIEKRGSLWKLNLIALWISYQEQVTDGGKVLTLIGEIPQDIRERNPELLTQVLSKIHPYEIASNEEIGREWINRSKKMSGYEELLLCASITGLLSFEKATDMGIGWMVFYSSNDAAASSYLDSYAARCREDIVSEKPNYFFNEYTPKTSKSLKRWLDWFCELKDTSDLVNVRIGEAVDNILKRDPNKVSMDQFVNVCISYDVWSYSRLFPRIFFDPPRDLSLTLDEAFFAQKCIDDILSEKTNHCFHNFKPKSLTSLKKWLEWFSEIADINAETEKVFGNVIDSLLLLSKSKDSIEQLLELCKTYKVQSHSTSFRIVETTFKVIKDIEKSTAINRFDNIGGAQILDVYNSMSKTKTDLEADVYVAILKAIRRSHKLNWKTPLAYLIEALVFCNRISEAMILANDSPDLQCGKSKSPAKKYIEKYDKVRREPPSYEVVLDKIANSFIETWKFKGNKTLIIRRHSTNGIKNA